MKTIWMKKCGVASTSFKISLAAIVSFAVSGDAWAGTFDATIDEVTYTIVEADPFRLGGVVGNTLATSSDAPSDVTLFWSNLNNTTDGLWWNRTTVTGNMANYVALGGTNSINVLNLNTEAAATIEIRTTVMGLDPGTYDVFTVYASNGAWSVTSDLGVSATTVHTADRTEPTLVNNEVFGRDIILDYLGTTDGDVTSFEVFSDAGDPALSERTYWIGVAYVKVASVLPFSITDIRHDAPTDTTELTWESSEGELFDIRKSFDLTGDPSTWPIVMAQVRAAPAPAATTTMVVDMNATEPEAFYKVFRVPPPPVFEDDFETDKGWTTEVTDANGNTEWQRGTPSGVGPASGAGGSAMCFGTNLGTNYDSDADIWLRSPAIDLTGPGLSGARLTFQQFKDIEIAFDEGSIRVLLASDNTQLGADIATGIDGDSDWEEFSVSLPPEAIGEVIKIEFQFTSDPLVNEAGWYLDDVVVTRQ